MSNNISLKKGLDIPVAGCAEPKVSQVVVGGCVAVRPSDFRGLNPRLLVKEGDPVQAGSPVLADKKCPEILITSPVSGTVKEVVRGDKRKLLAVLIDTDGKDAAVDFGARKPESLQADQVKHALLESGLWPFIIQRPYGIIADPACSPKAIFVSAFDTAPLAADPEFTLADRVADIQAAVTALAKIAAVHVSLDGSLGSKSAFDKLSGVQKHYFTGRHPAGNVGIQISHICPIRKEETVWTVSLEGLAAIGRLFNEGRVALKRKVAVGGPAAVNPAYAEMLPGAPMKGLSAFYGKADGLRLVSGDILTGENVGEDGYLGFHDTQVTILREGTDTELFGWARPLRFNQYSADHSYFHWLLTSKSRRYAMDTNLHGGPRAFVMSDSYYGKVLPMDIYPLYLIKACLAGDIEKMEKFGIYEVLPEDLATCEFIDPSKNSIQDIIQKGIDLMIKEMA